MNHRTITAGLLASAALLGGCDRLQGRMDRLRFASR
jgi:hypothetical protein